MWNKVFRIMLKNKEIKGQNPLPHKPPKIITFFFKPKCFKCLYCYNEYRIPKIFLIDIQKNCQKNVDMVQLVIKEKDSRN